MENLGMYLRGLSEEWHGYIATMEYVSEPLRYRAVANNNNVERGRPRFIIGASLSEPHTSERFRRVNHAQQKTDKNDCRLKYHTNSTKSRKNHSVDY